MHVYICRTEGRGLVQDKWTLPETHQTKNTSSIQSTEVHQQRQNIDIKENQVIFLNLFLGGTWTIGASRCTKQTHQGLS